MTGFGLEPLLYAASVHVGHPVVGDERWMHLEAEDLERLTDGDRELVHVVTGERLTPGASGETPVSFFALQIALDRAVGPLADGCPVTIGYVENVYDAYEGHCPDGNPFSGDLFDLALAFLVGRDLARLDSGVVRLD